MVLSLQAAARKLERSHSGYSNEIVPWLTQENVSQLIFVDGKRGTGKTSLMLTLVHLLSNPRADSQIEDFESLGVTPQFRDQIVILEPLDMEPLPPATPILSAILARLNSAAKRLGVASRKQRGLLDNDLHEDRGYKRFVQLKNKIARALDGNLDARKGSLDREQYGTEVINQEDDRLHLRSLLSESLLALSNSIPNTHDRESGNAPPRIFLVPVDDVDLNPERCLELLRLLRHYSVPQLFFVLMGQFELAEQIVKLRISKEYEQAGRPDSSLSAVSPEDLKGKIAQVAVANLQKLIPHKVELPAITLNKILDFCPLSVTGN